MCRRGAVFGPAELVFGIYEPADYTRLKTVVNAMQLVEDDYLGGAGSRGSGKVQFTQIEVFARQSGAYDRKIEIGSYDTVQALANDFDQIKEKLAREIAIKAG